MGQALLRPGARVPSASSAGVLPRYAALFSDARTGSRSVRRGIPATEPEGAHGAGHYRRLDGRRVTGKILAATLFRTGYRADAAARPAGRAVSGGAPGQGRGSYFRRSVLRGRRLSCGTRWVGSSAPGVCEAP